MRSLVAGLGLISMLAALIYGGYLAAASMSGGVSKDDASSGPSVALRVSGTPGLKFSGNYATPKGSENLSGTVAASPTEYDIGGGGVAGVNVITANVRKQGNGELKAEIVQDGRVVQSKETNAASDSVSLTYSP
jgi:hypothetical protein